MLFQHGYALLVGVGRSAYRAWSLPRDVKPFDVPGSALAGEELAAALRAIDAARLLVFVDSCHAAGMATAKDADALELPGQFKEATLPTGLADALQAASPSDASVAHKSSGLCHSERVKHATS